MSQERNLASQISQLLVAYDTLFFAQAVDAKRKESIHIELLFALSPFISMYIVESAQWAKGIKAPVPQQSRQFEETVRISRQRLKLLSDSKQTMVEIEEQARVLTGINQEWFKNSQSGVLSRLLRPFQKDLGLFFLGNEVVNTTDVKFLDLGITSDIALRMTGQEALKPYAFNLAFEWGRHLRWLLDSFGVVEDRHNVSNVSSLSVGYLDLHSEKFYADITYRLAPQRPTLGPILTSMLSTVNTARLLLPLIGIGYSLPLLKWRFVALYQAIANLKRVRDEHYRESKFFSDQAIERVNEVLSNDSLRIIGGQRILRNALVHYEIRERQACLLSEEIQFFGIVEACSSNLQAQEIATHVDQGLDSVAHLLHALLVRNMCHRDYYRLGLVREAARSGSVVMRVRLGNHSSVRASVQALRFPQHVLSDSPTMLSAAPKGRLWRRSW